MKITRLFAIIAAAGVFAACQNEEHIAPVAKTFEVSATASVPATKTAISADGEGYVPTWKAGDKIAIVEKALATNVYASNALQADALQATFTATMNQVSADAYAYCAVYPYEAFKTTTDLANLVCTVPAEQTPATMTSFDGNADILVSEVINLTAQPTAEALSFNMRRLTATGMVSFKNLQLMSGEKVNSWTIKTAVPMAGTVTVNPADADLAFSATQTSNSVKVVLPEAREADFTSCFTCLPCTLASGTEYEVTVHTNLRNITKTAVVNTPLVFTAGKVMEFGVTMTGATKLATVESFSDEYDYVITVTTGGVTYILPNAEKGKNPELIKISSIGLTLSDHGTLIGNVDELYRWKASCTVENEVVKVSFRTSTRKLYVCDRAQGLGVVDDVAKLSYTDRTYYDYFIATAVEGGYRLFVADDVNDDDANGRNVACDTENDQWRLTTTGHVINFHRIAKATFSETSSDAVKYPVIINADDVVAGKYVIAGYNAVHNDYYLLPGTEIASQPIASVASENGIRFEDNILVTDPANVSDLYVWNITPSATSGYYTIQNVQTDNYIFSRDSAGGVIVGPVGIHSKHKNEWTFNNIGGVMVAQVSGCTTRALVPYDVPGVYWRMQGTSILTDYILLIPINE